MRYAAFVVSDAGTCDAGACDASVTVTLDASLVEGRWPLSPVVRHGELCEFDLLGGYGRISLDVWEASLRLGRQDFQISLDYFLKILWAYLAFRRGGLLFHSAGLFVNGAVYLFTGQGGSGKSTVVALSPHAQALNDDLVVLRPFDGSWRAYGTPFWNLNAPHRDGQVACGPVVRILKLVQDQQTYLEPMSVSAASGELIANAFVMNTDPLELPAVMSRCGELAQAVKVQRLHFRKSADFWSILQT